MVRRSQRDLSFKVFPKFAGSSELDALEYCAVLFERLEQETVESLEWYLNDKRKLRFLSRLLRFLAILTGSAGLVVPLIPDSVLSDRFQWGYICFGIAATFLGFDRLFGVSSAWMRDMLSVAVLREILQRYQLEWALATLSREIGPEQIAKRMGIVSRLGGEVSSAVASETSAWANEFKLNFASLQEMIRTGVVEDTSSTIRS